MPKQDQKGPDYRDFIKKGKPVSYFKVKEGDSVIIGTTSDQVFFQVAISPQTNRQVFLLVRGNSMNGFVERDRRRHGRFIS